MAKARTAYFSGVDYYGRLVFKEGKNYYCLTDLFDLGSTEDERKEAVSAVIVLANADQVEIVFKGRSFEGEPEYPVADVELALRREE